MIRYRALRRFIERDLLAGDRAAAFDSVGDNFTILVAGGGILPGALREARINALIHRDYFDPHGEISIRVSDDRVVVWNLGELPPGITVADLKKTPHDSRPVPDFHGMSNLV